MPPVEGHLLVFSSVSFFSCCYHSYRYKNNVPDASDALMMTMYRSVSQINAPAQSSEALRLDNLCYHYGSDKNPVHVLSDVSLSVMQGETCAITGPSGAGKSTLMYLVGLLERPKSGKISLAGQDAAGASSDTRARLRNEHIGFVFQGFNLLPRLTALENVALPLMYRGLSKPAAREFAATQLIQVGLSERLNHRPNELSGGQCQRVAIARALAGSPSLLLADEPTGNLDDETGEMIVNMLLEMNAHHNTTLIMVTHDEGLASRMKRQFFVAEGRVAEL
jgi:predicted ABC-type transport system involved in lysophospholipase L1 biosynthesis ATPase subunit